ncbi:MAG: TMEM175 family protein [Cyclobacteriaceae bacterium]
MIRQALKASDVGKSSNFQFRGLDNTRIEALSDGVFAIAIALLLISSNVPTTYAELVIFLNDFIPFSATIAILMSIWYEHFIFFLRYGLKDGKVVFLNSILLFLILFYVYPLKFLFKVLFQLFKGLLYNDYSSLATLFSETIRLEDAPTLMVVYGIGAASIFFAFVLLYSYALRHKDDLKLTAYEIFETKSRLTMNLISASIPLISAMIGFARVGGDRWSFIISGWVYFLYPILMPLL